MDPRNGIRSRHSLVDPHFRYSSGYTCVRYEGSRVYSRLLARIDPAQAAKTSASLVPGTHRYLDCMGYGDVLARSSEGERGMERLRTRERDGGGRRLLGRSFVFSWATFVISVALVVVIGEEQMSGWHALAFALLLLVGVLSLLTAVVVTSYIFLRGLTGMVKRVASDEQPQDNLAAAVLDSTSPLRLVPLAILVFVAAIAAGSNFGAVGFFATFALGLICTFSIASHLNVMSQRVEVLSHEVRFALVGSQRSVKASDIADIEVSWVRVPRSASHITFYIRGQSPMVLAGNFVSDPERVERFVEDAHTVLRLHQPKDAPLPPTPQDAQQ